MKRILCALAFFTLLLLPTGRLLASPILDFTGGYNYMMVSPPNTTLGWEFTTTSHIEVNALGIWDYGADGLADSHQLGLWTADGTLLASVTITNDNSFAVVSTAASGDWRFTRIHPLNLGPGDYVLGATYLAYSPDWFVPTDENNLSIRQFPS